MMTANWGWAKAAEGERGQEEGRVFKWDVQSRPSGQVRSLVRPGRCGLRAWAREREIIS
jgi:hypothetical protein